MTAHRVGRAPLFGSGVSGFEALARHAARKLGHRRIVAAAHHNRHEGSTTLNGYSIVVVEDDSDTLELFAISLVRLGAEVRTAKTVEIAIELLTSRRPDAVLCDLHLPGVDGYSLLEGIRADPLLRDLPVIAISGSHPAVERERALRAGFAQHLTKPTRLNTIIEAMLTVLPLQPSHID